MSTHRQNGWGRNIAALLALLSVPSAVLIAAEMRSDFHISYTELGGVVSIKLANTSTATRLYRFHAKTTTNLDAGAITKLEKICPPGATVPLIVMAKIDPAKPIQLEYECTSEDAANVPPPPTSAAIPDPKYLYRVPWALGKKMWLGQGYNGSITHMRCYALDFNFPFGTPVHAMRGGVVKNVVNGVADHPEGYEYLGLHSFGNNVVIAHSDGTTATYAHLKYGCATVTVGQEVNEGEIIAHSGNSGRSAGPHLHVEVSDWRKGTIPVRYKTAENPDGVELKGGTEVAAPPEPN